MRCPPWRAGAATLAVLAAAALPQRAQPVRLTRQRREVARRELQATGETPLSGLLQHDSASTASLIQPLQLSCARACHLPDAGSCGRQECGLRMRCWICRTCAVCSESASAIEPGCGLSVLEATCSGFWACAGPAVLASARLAPVHAQDCCCASIEAGTLSLQGRSTAAPTTRSSALLRRSLDNAAGSEQRNSLEASQLRRLRWTNITGLADIRAPSGSCAA